MNPGVSLLDSGRFLSSAHLYGAVVWLQVIHTGEAVWLEHLSCEVQPGEGILQEDLKADPRYYKKLIWKGLGSLW